jgi:transcriptional regulator with GAF, ATPase, and Fis domain
VLQEKQFERIGGTKTIISDFRILAATNKELEEEVVKGRFREDSITG